MTANEARIDVPGGIQTNDAELCISRLGWRIDVREEPSHQHPAIGIKLQRHWRARRSGRISWRTWRYQCRVHDHRLSETGIFCPIGIQPVDGIVDHCGDLAIRLKRYIAPGADCLDNAG